jgi:enoyl-CoA hydratase
VSALLLVDDDDGVRTITINRPDKKNALTTAMREELCRLLDEADVDAQVTAVILTATDPVFSAGVDVKDLDPNFDPRVRRFTVNPGRALRAMRTPVVCAVNGSCVSGALEMALSSTFVVASERASFADTHARLNVVPAWGLSVLLPRAVGLRMAREMSLTGNPVDAADALRSGLVNHVVAHDDLLPFTRTLAGQIASTPAVAKVLSLYEQGEDLGANAAFALEMTAFADLSWDSDGFRSAASRTKDR